MFYHSCSNLETGTGLPFDLQAYDLAYNSGNPAWLGKNPILMFLWGDLEQAFMRNHATAKRVLKGEEFLHITPGPAGTSEVQTITLTNPANDGGYYQLAWGGDVTDSLVYNASVATMKAAFEALPSVKRAGLTVTFSGTAAATFTATFLPYGPVNDLIRIIPTSLNDGGVAEIGSTAITTPGVRGFSAGTYQIDILGLCWSDMVMLPNGNIESYKTFSG